MLPSLLLDGVRGVGALVLGGSVAGIAYRIGAWLVPRAGLSVRWSATAIVAFWLCVASFWALTPLHSFRFPVVLALALGTVLVGARRGGWRSPAEAFREDLRRLASFLRRLGALERSLAVALLAMALVRFLRALAAPPLGWDDLTYHLVKAGRFVQAGGFVDVSAPDAWRSYGSLAVAGEILWSWAMLPLHGDLLIAPAVLAVWASAVLGVYAGARSFGASARPAVLAALAVGAMPAALAYVSSAYVDDLTLATTALGSVFVVRLLRDGPLREAPLAAAGLALAAGTKLLALPLLAIGGAAVLVRIARDTASARARAAVLVAVAAVSTVAVPTYVRSWVEHGSPFYPFAVHVAGVELSAGNEEAVAVTERILSTPGLRYSSADSLRFLLVRPGPSGAFLNPGPAAPVLLLLALLAVPRLRRRSAPAAVYLWLVAAVLLGAYWSAMEAFRATFMVASSGRYLTPAFAALAVLGARCELRIARPLAALAAGLGVLFSLPVGWRPIDATATAWVLVPVAVLGIGGWTAVRLARRGRRTRRIAAALAVLVWTGAGVAGVARVRSAFRYPIYESAADPAEPTFLLHPLDDRYASAWPIWRALDGDSPRTIAVAAGFDRVGHNWYVYPLLGSRLQNRVTYVPVTPSGALVDYRRRHELRRRASRGCWLRRLRDLDVDDLVLLAPRQTVEERWVRRSPRVFRQVTATRGARHAAYRIDRERLAVLTLPRCGEAAPGPPVR